MRRLVGASDLLWLTFDSLRYDTAASALALGLTPNLARWLGPRGWERRETPGTFTLPAHWAFFHGFLPTDPDAPGAPRLFAIAREDSVTTGPGTCVFTDQANVIAGLAARGYLTVCVGGVGFFDKQNPLGNVLPSLFAESTWEPAFGTRARDSARHQVDWAVARLARVPRDQRVLMFLNLSATHVPHAHYANDPAATDSVATQRLALADLDRHLPRLVDAMTARGPVVCLWMADHGEAYGEDGRFGHRIAHPTVLTVPYAELELGLARG